MNFSVTTNGKVVDHPGNYVRSVIRSSGRLGSAQSKTPTEFHVTLKADPRQTTEFRILSVKIILGGRGEINGYTNVGTRSISLACETSSPSVTDLKFTKPDGSEHKAIPAFVGVKMPEKWTANAPSIDLGQFTMTRFSDWAAYDVGSFSLTLKPGETFRLVFKLEDKRR